MLISPHRRPSSAAATSDSSSDDEAGPTMEIAPERSRTTTLENFTSLPCFDVTWGRRKQLRCVKDFDLYHHNQRYFHTSPSSPSPEKRRSPNNDCDGGDGDGIESVREKLMLDFKTEVDQMKASIFKRNHNNGENRPWNLRTRRAVCKIPNFNGGGGDRKGNFTAEIKTPPRRGGAADVSGEVEVGGSKPRARAKFSVSLSKLEIEEDFLSILGNRPARRPKKRPKYLQKQLDALFPGSWLSEVTPDMYKVNEIADPASKR